MTALVLLAAMAQQPPPPDTQAIVAAMREASFLAGDWKGEGWKLINGKREAAYATEKVEWQAGGTVLSINGRGLDSTGKVVHEAYGVVFYDIAAKSHRVRTFLSDGNTGDFQAVVKDGALTWHIPAARPIRYIVKLDDQKRWHEIGEVNVSEDRWVQFFEMTLNRVKK